MSSGILSSFYNDGGLTPQGEQAVMLSGIILGIALLVGTAVLDRFLWIQHFHSTMMTAEMIGSAAFFSTAGLSLLIVSSLCLHYNNK